MAERVFKETVDVYEWVGICPRCGNEQRSYSAEIADMICSQCARNHLYSEIEKRMSKGKYTGWILLDMIENSAGADLYFLKPDMSVYCIHLSGYVKHTRDIAPAERILKSTYISDAQYTDWNLNEPEKERLSAIKRLLRKFRRHGIDA